MIGAECYRDAGRGQRRFDRCDEARSADAGIGD
jgi:hypothetical protein